MAVTTTYIKGVHIPKTPFGGAEETSDIIPHYSADKMSAANGMNQA